MGTGSALNVVEVFPSFQGEGLLVGAPQVFVRLGGCNLQCSYCDTPEARREAEMCRIHGWEGSLEAVANPLLPGDLAGRIAFLWRPGMHSVSLTGGEPLVQAEALADLLPLLRDRGMAVYLETNGTLPGELGKVVHGVDWIAMDLKLPYSQGGKEFLGVQREFLRTASKRKVFLKVVVEENTPGEELERFCRELTGTPAVRDIPLVLQPVSTPVGGVEGESGEGAAMAGSAGGMKTGPSHPPGGAGRRRWEVGMSSRRAAELAALAAAYFREVRVIPQLQRAWKIR